MLCRCVGGYCNEIQRLYRIGRKRWRMIEYRQMEKEGQEVGSGEVGRDDKMTKQERTREKG